MTEKLHVPKGIIIMPERIDREPYHREPYRVEPIAPVAPPRPPGKEEPRPPKPDLPKQDTPEPEPPPSELTDDQENHTISTRRQPRGGLFLSFFTFRFFF